MAEQNQPNRISLEDFLNEHRFQAHPDYLLREIAGESILVPTGSETENANRMFSLNSSCTWLWKAFQEPHTTKEVIAEALEEFDADEETLTRDIVSFVLDYLKHGMMIEVNE